MFENILRGTTKYWAWIGTLLVFILIGLGFYLRQLEEGLTVTGLSRDVPWGFYISQFTFLVGVAASAVILVLPYYLHDFKAFGKMVILGEFLAIAAVIMCVLFVFVDMGQPQRVSNVLLHPTPGSVMFWDVVVLSGYLVLNALIAWVTFGAESRGVAPTRWIKPVIILSIPWAISIHTVTAFLYAGLGARPFWLTAILAPRFLASAFASGPALLILLCLLMRKVTRFDAGSKAIQKLGVIATYALAINFFFIAVELFTALYSDIPHHVSHFQYLFFGLDGHDQLVPWMWFSQVLGLGTLALLFIPAFRRREALLGMACVAIIVAIWIDKGLGMVCGGFIPSPLGEVTEYWPTATEIFVGLGIYSLGALFLTLLYKMALGDRETRGA
jgi:Ni/Fe-hydrogenase subunit HybB-like protein